MKKYILFVLVLFAGTAFGQRAMTFSGFSNNTYIQSTVDTSQAYSIDPLSDVAILFDVKDSCHVYPFFDYRVAGGSQSWVQVTVATADTFSTASNTGAQKGYNLRGNGTNRIPGASQVRVRFAAQATGTSGNGTNTNTFIAFIMAKP
jgi:hypothetical protein